MRTTGMWLLGLSVACGMPSVDRPDPDHEAVVQEMDVAQVWRGFEHEWTYNHRWNEIGGGLYALSPDRPDLSLPYSAPSTEEPEWAYLAIARAGTGRDRALHTAHGDRLDADGARFLAVSQAFDLHGREGQREVYTLSVTAPVDADFADRDLHEVVLDGFWLRAVDEEAKKPSHFAIDVGRPQVGEDGLVWPVTVELELDCDTPECKGCSFGPAPGSPSTKTDYDLFLSFLVVGGESDTFASARFDGPETDSPWQGPAAYVDCLFESPYADCWEYGLACDDGYLSIFDMLDPEAGRTEVTAHPRVPASWRDTMAVGLVGLELTLDAPHHTLALELSATDVHDDDDGVVFTQNVRFENWRHGMNTEGQELDQLAFTAFGTSGSFSGRLRYAALAFPEAQVDPWSHVLAIDTRESSEDWRLLGN